MKVGWADWDDGGRYTETLKCQIIFVAGGADPLCEGKGLGGALFAFGSSMVRGLNVLCFAFSAADRSQAIDSDQPFPHSA